MSCTHRQNATITVRHDQIVEYLIEDGSLEDLSEGMPDPAHYELLCDDCGYSNSWAARQVPRWVLRLINS